MPIKKSFNQSGFTTAALGFVVFGILMAFIVFSYRFNNDSLSIPDSSPHLSEESSTIPSSTARPTKNPAPSTSPKPSTSPISSASPSQSSQTSSTSPSTSSSSSPTPSGRFIRITSPNGGETYKVGSTLTITWEYNDLAQCVIKYVTENGAESSLFISAKPEEKSKQIPILESYLGPLSSVKLKISMDCYSLDSNYAGDTSDSFFTIIK